MEFRLQWGDLQVWLRPAPKYQYIETNVSDEFLETLKRGQGDFREELRVLKSKRNLGGKAS